MTLLTALGTRIKLVDPQHAAIFRGMVTVALFALVGKAMSAAKEMAVAYRYGLAAEVDAYQFLSSLISWPIGVWCSVLTAVLVPLVARMRELDKTEIPRFRAELLGLALAAGLLLTLLAWVGIRTLLAYGGSGLPDATAQSVAAALPGMILMIPLGVVIALQSAWLLSAGRHVNTLFDCIPTLFIAAAILIVPGGGIGPLVGGTLAGCVAHLLALFLPLSRSGDVEAPRFSLASRQWEWFWQGFGIMLAGQALMSFTVVIDQFYAVSLGTGSNATLGYANRVLSLIIALAAIAVSRATLPVFSQTRPDGGDGRAIANCWARVMFMAGIVVMFASYVAGPWAIALLFERGQFSPDDTLRVAQVFRFGLVQLPFYFSSMVLVSFALSRRRYALIFWTGIIGCAGKIAGNVLLVPNFGVDGIALANSVVYGLNALFLVLALSRHDELKAGSESLSHGRTK